MADIKIIVTLQLNSPDLLEDWKRISADISADLKANATGFVSRESGIDEDGMLYCILQWNSVQDSEAFMQSLMIRPDFMEKMADFARVVNMETMSKKVIELF
jgi:hypothetical protein